MTEGFIGDWRVTEYVHDPDGTYRGRIHQERHLDQRADGAVRVTQFCRPDSSLEDHPMGAFTGEWVFELTVDGDQRRYRGPDVVGGATEWAPGAMTGTGLWPRFGHDFDSYAVLAADDRQLTGGRFGVQARPAAVIAGVAVPASAVDEGAGPELDLDWWPEGRWAGEVTRDGTRTTIERQFGHDGWTDEIDGAPGDTVTLIDGALTTADGGRGVAQRFGPSLRASAWTPEGSRREVLLVADSASGTVAGFDTRIADGHSTVSVIRLTPTG